MVTIERILHPTDFSAHAEAALVQAIELARRCGAELHVLHVAPVFGEDPVRGAFETGVDEAAFYRHLRDEADARMQAALAPHDPAGVRVKRIHTRGQAPGETIRDYAEQEEVDLIVMGTHGRRGLRRMLLGSVTHEVLRQARRPVLVTHAPAEAERTEAPVARVVAPVDLSVFSIDVLTHASALAALYEVPLQVLHVIGPASTLKLYRMGGPDRPLMETELEARAMERLQWLADEVDVPRARASFTVAAGYPPEEIQQATGPSDLIVVASHGLTEREHLPLGSVAERIVQAAACPVLVVKPFGKSLVQTGT